ncbi:hypothetical protein GUJ93_ZPchr0010g10092 [Zizania palustris]|uniref:Uncharacterized protein n=1 Tax=Zizania palustris TaxID=103762 RepID=A0A8J6BHK3_ZIZPA|nr:hypothetical protein GUJ93_ZPchr0010g10092 [Zizania palustris]
MQGGSVAPWNLQSGDHMTTGPGPATATHLPPAILALTCPPRAPCRDRHASPRLVSACTAPHRAVEPSVYRYARKEEDDAV